MFLGLTIVCENWISNREKNMKSFRIESNNISGTKFLEKFTFFIYKVHPRDTPQTYSVMEDFSITISA